jgi:hypothetical protein
MPLDAIDVGMIAGTTVGAMAGQYFCQQLLSADNWRNKPLTGSRAGDIIAIVLVSFIALKAIRNRRHSPYLY